MFAYLSCSLRSQRKQIKVSNVIILNSPPANGVMNALLVFQALRLLSEQIHRIKMLQIMRFVPDWTIEAATQL